MKMNSKTNNKLSRRVSRFAALIVSLIVCSTMLSGVFALNAFAKATIVDIDPNAKSELSFRHVSDDTGSIPAAQMNELEARAKSLSEEYKCDIGIVLVDKLAEYDCDGTESGIRSFAEQLFKEGSFGYGSQKDAVIYAVSKGDRKYDVYVHGEGSMGEIITDDERDDIAEKLKDELSDVMDSKNYAKFGDVFDRFLDEVEKQLVMNANGVTTPMGTRIIWGVILSAIGILIAALILVSMRNKMKTIRKKQTAVDYVIPGSFNLNDQRDTYLYTTTRVIHHEDSNSGSGSSGGGGGHSSGSF